MHRRELIGLFGLAATGSLWPRRPYAQTTRDAERLRARLFDAGGPLAIDSHCHLFNATDLQVNGFIQQVALRDHGALGAFAARFGPYLQRLGWKLAPSATEELEFYQGLGASMFTVDDEIETAERTQYEATREALIAEAQTIERQLIEAAPEDYSAAEYLVQMETARALQTELPEDYDEFLDRVDEEDEGDPQTFGVGFFSLLGFLISQFQYRLTSYRHYLRRYNKRRSSIKIDLLTPSLVDYDYWLAKGGATKSTLPQQIEVMAALSKLTEGSVHAFVPFDPFREAAFRAHEGEYSSLELVTSAIESGAFIGVKLYPPMGFAPFGNAGNDAIWKTKDLPPIAHADGFGQRLDDALHDLYRYCVENEVPVLAHSNISNTADAEYDQLLDFRYWRLAIEEHPGLRLNLGHFGGAGSTSSYDEHRVSQFAALMPAHANLYADSSYFGELLEDADAMNQRLRAALNAAPGLAKRLVYGSDWKMLALERKSGRYLKRMIELAEKLGLDPNAFFGGNAARYLGLELDGKTRARIRAFHASEPPGWMAKTV